MILALKFITPHYHFGLFSCRIATGIDATPTVEGCSYSTVGPVPLLLLHQQLPHSVEQTQLLLIKTVLIYWYKHNYKQGIMMINIYYTGIHITVFI